MFATIIFLLKHSWRTIIFLFRQQQSSHMSNYLFGKCSRTAASQASCFFCFSFSAFFFNVHISFIHIRQKLEITQISINGGWINGFFCFLIHHCIAFQEEAINYVLPTIHKNSLFPTRLQHWIGLSFIFIFCELIGETQGLTSFHISLTIGHFRHTDIHIICSLFCSELLVHILSLL